MNRFYQGIILVLVIIIFLQNYCNKSVKCPDPPVSTDSTVTTKIDTGYLLSPPDSSVSYTPQPKWYSGITRHDSMSFGGHTIQPFKGFKPLEYTIVLQDDTSDYVIQLDSSYYLHALKPYIFSNKVYYEDTLDTQYGDVIVKDTLFNNRISSRQWITNFKVPYIETTTEKRILMQSPPKTQVYGGFDIVGHQGVLISQFGPSILVITPKQKVYDFSALYSSTGKWGGRVGAKFHLFNLKSKRK